MTLQILSLIISICLFLNVTSIVLLVIAMHGRPYGTEPTNMRVNKKRESYL
jgi:hypothetical protein